MASFRVCFSRCRRNSRHQQKDVPMMSDSILPDNTAVFLFTAALKLKYQAPSCLRYVSTDQTRLCRVGKFKACRSNTSGCCSPLHVVKPENTVSAHDFTSQRRYFIHTHFLASCKSRPVGQYVSEVGCGVCSAHRSIRAGDCLLSVMGL